jgi:hypothetical protein
MQFAIQIAGSSQVLDFRLEMLSHSPQCELLFTGGIPE